MVKGASSPQVAPTKAVAEEVSHRHILPNDLPNAVKHLTDTELDLLITAALEEAKRRGRNPSDQPKRSSSNDRKELATVSLTRGQVNAVRAAFKAGITPSRIARQFGISQSDVKKVLARHATQKEP
jgi:predicted DNA binding protein